MSAATAIVLTATLALTYDAVHRPSRSVLIFTAIADGYVSTAHPDTNYGTEAILRTSAVPMMSTFLRFSIKGLSVPVDKASLRLFSEDTSSAGFMVRPVENVEWKEKSITARNAPPYGEVAASSGPLTAHSWASIDVRELLTGNGELGFALTTMSHERISYDSREGVHAPQLLLETAGSGEGRSEITNGGSGQKSAATSLRAIIENVSASTAYRYGARDDHGYSLDSLKILMGVGGEYLGVHHSLVDGSFSAMVATSTDLLNWTYRSTLDTHVSQPTITALTDGGYLVVGEADSSGLVSPPSTWLRFLHYPSQEALLAGISDRSFDAPHTLAPPNSGAEGTPNVYSATLAAGLASSTITVGFHYLATGNVDRPARGILNDFSSWTAGADTRLTSVLRATGVTGSIGDRDYMAFEGYAFTVSEAQASPGPRWTPYLYERDAEPVTALRVKTRKGSISFGNPTFTNLRAPSGAAAVAVTFFIRHSGAADGETGELIYYHEYGPRPSGASVGNPSSQPPASTATDPVIVAAGDIACAGTNAPSSVACHQAATADLIGQLAPAGVLALGDEQYEVGSLDGFRRSYDASWGQFKRITYPAPGNHEYLTKGAAGYFAYYGKAAGDSSKGYYSFDIGAWHLVALNGNCEAVDGCGFGSAQEQWLRGDLAAHRTQCTLAFWHQPRFSSGQHGNEPQYAPFWSDLYDAGAEIVLNGHDHDYERFAPQDPSGSFDAATGIREFVVGTGGKSHYLFPRVVSNSEARNDTAFGVFALTLHPNSYDWQFLAEPGSTFTDAGTGTCHQGSGG